jgi:hypothetical protein
MADPFGGRIGLHRCGDQSSVRFFKADPPISRGGSCGRKVVGRGHFVAEVCGERAEKSTVGKALSQRCGIYLTLQPWVCLIISQTAPCRSLICPSLACCDCC